MAGGEPPVRARRFAYDPWLHTADGAEKLAKACTAAGATLVPGRAEPDRFRLDRAPCPAARPRHRARPDIRRRDRAGEAGAHPGRDRKAQRRDADRLRPAQCRLDVQHPRRGRVAHAAAARLRARAAPGTAGDLSSTAASFPTKRATTSKRSPTCASRAHSPTISRPSAPRKRPCGSTRRPPRMRLRG